MSVTITADGLTPTLSPPFIAPDDTTSLSSGSYTSTAIFDRLYFALVSFIEILQGTAAARAERLNVLAKWQSAYTDLATQVPIFLTGDSSPFGATDTDTGQIRTDLNQLNSMLTEQLRNKRTLVNDDANAMQTGINQSTDAVDNAANMATALIQEMSTILSSVYR